MGDTKTEATVIDLNRPYLGWFDHYQEGWQAVVVYLKDGQRKAYRLGNGLPFARVTEMCEVLSETTGLPVAGELSKREFALPVADTTEETPNG
ncbi:hypothetical protein E1286_05020 [Nonomuraea terrae]|uniref:Uncharacterized protein n=1 Tax=Nonomuraea terrae TaxID=2530383 RepID=A0A4R4Z8P8_9ACTN|nr:hypothetical protein [Nonomuraea terrae]TDD54555.1 hypothetical protein E1286_05020 [Nonomuraea terrae]